MEWLFAGAEGKGGSHLQRGQQVICTTSGCLVVSPGETTCWSLLLVNSPLPVLTCWSLLLQFSTLPLALACSLLKTFVTVHKGEHEMPTVKASVMREADLN